MLAAGSGNRMNNTINKVFLPLPPYDAPALCYPLAALDKNSYIDEIVVVIREEDLPRLDNILDWGHPDKPVCITLGGETRYDSVRSGLQEATGEIVLIHDGARPMLRQCFITDCIEAMEESPGAVVGVRCYDTVCTADEQSRIMEYHALPSLYRLQTPQCFDKDILLQCHKQAADKATVTDDSSLLVRGGYPVTILPGSEENIKLTVPEDVETAGRYILRDEEIFGLVKLTVDPFPLWDASTE